MSGFSQRELSFNSGAESCAATLYLPDRPGPHPLVILAHGFAGTRKGRLWAYGERFAAAGIAAFVFDYRHFGDSSGEPRQLLSISRQLEDWRAAIAFSRSLPEVDAARLALWGTSYSGGHAVTLAAGDPRIKAVIAQTPFTDGPSALHSLGPLACARLVVAGLRDLIGALLGREPHLIPVVAAPGETGAMTHPGSYEGYFGLYEDRADFPNRFTPRASFPLALHRPAASAAGLECPLLVLVCENDVVTPAPAQRAMAAAAPRGRLVEYGGERGHFDIYVGELFERTVADQIAFLGEHLGVSGGDREPVAGSVS